MLTRSSTSVAIASTMLQYLRRALRAAPPPAAGMALVRFFSNKLHSGAKKRFKLRGDGRWVYTMTGRNHLLAGSSRSRQTLKKRKKKAISAKAIQKTMHLLQPYARRRAVARA